MNRKDLQELIEFVENTPSMYPHHDSHWWVGPFPASPDIYREADWERKNPPIIELFRDYVIDLGRECDETGYSPSIQHWHKACWLLAELEV